MQNILFEIARFLVEMKFMVLIDGSKSAERAFDMASEFASKADEVVLCHACQFPDTVGMAPIGVSLLPDMKLVEEQRFMVIGKSLRKTSWCIWRSHLTALTSACFC